MFKELWQGSDSEKRIMVKGKMIIIGLEVIFAEIYLIW
jgi:hypothetical protein